MKKTLWIRKLFCGHSRPTNIAFISKDYEKPVVGELAYCRECNQEFEIMGVTKASEEEIKELEELKNDNL